MLNLATKALGQIQVKSDHIIAFPEGILGFQDQQSFVILPHREHSPFKWLQSIQDKSLAFILIDPVELFQVTYQQALQEEDLNFLHLDQSLIGGQAYAIVTVPQSKTQQMTANLQGPIIINSKERRAKQCISSDPQHILHFPILQDTGKK